MPDYTSNRSSSPLADELETAGGSRSAAVRRPQGEALGTVREMGGSAAEDTFVSSRRHRFSAEREDRPVSVFDAIEQSRRIIDAARADAESLLADARASAEKEQETAKNQGLEEGRLEAAKLLLEAEQLRQRIIEESAHELLEVALGIAEEVIGTALQEQPQSITDRIKRAVEHVLNAKTVTIVVHPSDMEYVRNSLDEMAARLDSQVKISIRSNSSIQPGDARLETDVSVVEARISTHFAAMKSHLLGPDALSLERSTDNGSSTE